MKLFCLMLESCEEYLFVPATNIKGAKAKAKKIFWRLGQDGTVCHEP
jgi:hypothetical protein